MTASPPSPGEASTRIVSIDQLRGYTIAGMILINFVTHFEGLPWAFSHHREGYSYADTIAPLFLFIVGIGYNLSFNSRVEGKGLLTARWEAARRYGVITLIGVVIYGPFDWREWWDALVDIGLSGFLALPFMHASGVWRVAAAFGYLVLFQVLFTWTPYGPYLRDDSFDGGPLGPLSWVFSLLLGTLVWDWVKMSGKKTIIFNSLMWGVGLTVGGVLLEIEWPGFKAHWPYSQRYMTMPYTVLSTGLAFLTFLVFYCLDLLKVQFRTLSIFGMNPLVLYVFHLLLVQVFHRQLPEECTTFWILFSFSLFFFCCYVVAWRLWKDRIIIKI